MFKIFLIKKSHFTNWLVKYWQHNITMTCYFIEQGSVIFFWHTRLSNSSGRKLPCDYWIRSVIGSPASQQTSLGQPRASAWVARTTIHDSGSVTHGPRCVETTCCPVVRGAATLTEASPAPPYSLPGSLFCQHPRPQSWIEGYLYCITNHKNAQVKTKITQCLACFQVSSGSIDNINYIH